MEVLYYNYARPPTQNYSNILQIQSDSRMCALASLYFQATISDVTGKGNMFLIKKVLQGFPKVSLRHHGDLEKKVSK